MAEPKKLTRRMLDELKPIKGRAVFIWDGELRGFGLKAEGAGTKSFVLQYRNAERQKRRTVLGRYGVMTLEQARDQARIMLGEIAKGEDPADKKRSQRNGLSVGALCDWYLTEAEAGRLLGRKGRPIKASTLYMDRSRIETHIRPLLGRRMVAALTLPDIERMQLDIAEGKTAKPRGDGRGRATVGGKGAAARSVTTLHSIFAHGKRHGLIESNPASGVRKFPDQKRTRRLSRAEISALGEALRELELVEHPIGLAIVRLLAVSGLRLNEAQGLQRKWVSDEGYINFADTKTDAQIRVIGSPALKIIRAQPVLEGSPYIFPSDGGQSHFIAADGVLGRICKRLGFEDVTAHTLRHTFGSIAGELGYSELTIAAMLGHAAGSVTGRYVHIDEAVKSAVERVSATISALLQGGSEKRIDNNIFSIGASPLLVGGIVGRNGTVTIRSSAG
ncbi:site-specific integrase [Sphingomonas sp. CL5.1]|uniref:tyrosine-type recombinase/integrase n=1 Tax=Sphingomonas sp. CL5.1 TaxID=2653203 RepID=UPI0015843701|nr:site-specific integrase [Sphingomonas sp. CL5.1]QKR98361.1 site-specific integrase [Sphingomonas sp. CL5.1]